MYIIKESADEIFASLPGLDPVKLDIDTSSTQMELMLKNKYTNQLYAYFTDSFLATPDEYIYSKVTTVTPYYMVVNGTDQTLVLEQSELPSDYHKKAKEYIPMILEPGEKQPLQF